MKTALLPNPDTISSVDPPNVYVSEPAQRRLEALRSSVEIRLAALEAALADPTRGDALEGLILDLSRVATEEAQAAAAHACVDTRLEAEMHVAQARSAAQAAIDQEHQASADVRRALEHVRQQLAGLEHEKHTVLQQARDVFEGELAGERAARGELERSAAQLERSASEAQRELDIEREAAQNLRAEIDRVDAQLRALTQEQANLATSAERIAAELAHAREALAGSQQAHAETQTQLALERNAVSELQRAATKSADQLTTAGRREAEARSAHEKITVVYDETAAELKRERQANAELRRAQKDLQSQVDGERTTSADAGRAHQELRQRFDAERAANAELKQSIAELHARLDAERASESDLARANRELQTQLETERATIAGLKRGEAELQSTIGDLQHAQSGLQAQFEAERAKAAELRRTAAQTEARLNAALEAERTATSHLAAATARAQELSKAAGQPSDAITRRLAQMASELETERTTLADLRRAHSELEARWEAERAATAELKQAVTRAETRSQTGAQEVREALAHSRAEVQTLRDDLEGARARVEALSGERADAERLWKESESRFKRATRERDELAAKLEAVPTPSEAPTQTVPIHTPLTVLPHPAYKAPHKAQTKPAAKIKEPEEGWVAVRMAARYGFDNPVAVQVNGAPSQLCDLSVGGCQVLSLSPLKPNQAIKILLAAEPKPVTCTGKIVWAKLEAPALGRPAGYRAGVQFTRPDESAIEAFIAKQRASVLA